VDVADTFGAVEALRPVLAARRRFTATIRGPLRSGKTTALASIATEAAEQWGMSVVQFGLLALAPADAHLLCRAVADTIEPGTSLEWFFRDDLAGTIAAVAYARSVGAIQVNNRHRRQAAAEFTARIKRAAGLTDSPADVAFLKCRHRDVLIIIELDQRARVTGRSLAEIHSDQVARGARVPQAFSLVAEAADFYAEFRHRERLVDDGDVLAGALYPADDCPLVLVDEAQDVPPSAQAAVARMFPRAALVAAGGPGGMIERLEADPATLRLQFPARDY